MTSRSVINLSKSSQKNAGKSWKYPRPFSPKPYDIDEYLTDYDEVHPAELLASHSPESSQAGPASLAEPAKRKSGAAPKKTSYGGGRRRRSSTSGHGLVSFEYFTSRYYTPMLGFDLELWWRRSEFGTRVNAIMVVFLLVVGIIYLGAGIFFLVSHFLQSYDSPYLCESVECRKASTWMVQTMNFSVDPCHNFFEFMCGNYQEAGKEGQYFQQLLDVPIYKVEHGEDTYLAKILNYRGTDEKLTQAIKYYQACIDDRDRTFYGFEAFKDLVVKVFGTKDFKTFESSTAAKDMELIAANMFRAIGHAVYLNMGFYNYPYIQVLKPVWWIKSTSITQDPEAHYFVEHMFIKIMELLEVPSDSVLIDQMMEGFRVFNEVMTKLDQNFTSYRDNQEEEFRRQVPVVLNGLCPPLGIQLDVYKVLENFTGEDPKRYSTYYSYATEKYFKGLLICFKEDPSKFSAATKITHQKTAFAGMWMFGLFYELTNHLDKNLGEDWQIPDGHRSEMIVFYHVFRRQTMSYQCFTNMWRTLGYIPSVRYLQATTEDPAAFNYEKETLFARLYEITREQWTTLPNTINRETKFLGNTLLRRGVLAELMMPFEGQLIDFSPDILPFTDDHLRNSIIGMEYTIEKARRTWIGSVHICPTVKWWGHGEFRGFKDELLSLQRSMVVSATFVTEKGAAKADKWETFLGRKPANYILFPLTLFNEPHTTETTALEHAGIHFKIIRTYLSLLTETTDSYIYEKYEGNHLIEIIDWHWSENDTLDSSHDCKLLHLKDLSDLDEADREYTYFQSTDFSYYLDHNVSNPREILNPYVHTFYTVVASKIAFRQLQQELSRQRKETHSFSLSDKERRYRIHRFLPGRLSKYSEEQLYFMAIVRHVCRGSWTKYDDDNIYKKHARYRLEAHVLNMLMQMEEFSKVWNCKQGTRMNLGEERCMNWKL